MPDFYTVITRYECDGCGTIWDNAYEAQSCCTAECEHCERLFFAEDLSTDRGGWGVVSCDRCYEEEEEDPQYAPAPEPRCARCSEPIFAGDDLRFDPVREQRYHAHCTSGHAAMAVAA